MHELMEADLTLSSHMRERVKMCSTGYVDGLVFGLSIDDFLERKDDFCRGLQQDLQIK